MKSKIAFFLVCVMAVMLSACQQNNSANKLVEENQKIIEDMNTKILLLEKKNEELAKQCEEVASKYSDTKDSVDNLSGTINGYVNNTLFGLEQESFRSIERRLSIVDKAYFVSCDFHVGIEKFFDTSKIHVVTQEKSNFAAVEKFLKDHELGERDVIVVPFEAENENEFFEYSKLYQTLLNKTNLLIYLDYAPRLATDSFIDRNTEQLDQLSYRFSDARLIYDDTEDYPDYKPQMANTIQKYLTGHTKIKFK